MRLKHAPGREARIITQRLADGLVGTPLERPARLLRRAGRALVPKRAESAVEGLDHAYDLQTLQVMQRVLEPDSSCVDVGCHRGSVLRQMLSLAPNGTHFAFEPLARLHEGLRRSFGSDPRIRLFDCALSDHEGVAEFQHVVSNPAYSGFRRRTYENADETVEQITVKTGLLDRLIPPDVAIRFVKIDVEGAELEVLRGAVQTIRRSRPFIVFEHGIGAADHYGTTPEDVYDLLVDTCGLSLFVMEAWLARGNEASLSRAEFCDEFRSGRNYYFVAGPESGPGGQQRR